MDAGAKRQSLLWSACWLVLLLLVIVDWALHDVALSGAYGLVTVLAGAVVPLRRVWITAAAVMAAAAVSFIWNGNFASMEWFVRLILAGALSAAALLISASTERRERRLAQMTLIAETAQRAILHSLPAAVDDVALAARYVSASDQARIGGDLYEVITTPFGARAIVGDVKGKGLDAVQLAATVLTGFRRAAEALPDLADVARELDVVVSAVADIEDFVTAVLVQFDADGSLLVVNIAHLPPVLIDSARGADARPLDTGEPVPPLGMHPDPTVTRTSWSVGSRLLMFTDGTTESRDGAGRFFEISDHAELLSQGSLEDALDRLVSALGVHVGHQLTDDVALVLAERRPRPGPQPGT